MFFRIITQSAANRSRVLSRTVSAMVLLLVLIFAGCGERQLTTPTPQMDIEPQFWVRVLLHKDIRVCKLKTGSSFSVSDPHARTPQARFGQAEFPIKVNIFAGKITIAGRSFTSNEIIIFPDKPHIFNLNGSDYRGKLKLTVNPGGGSFNAVNLVPLEPYLAGVVGAEMPDYWEPAALKAQAVAARTYCLYIKKQFGGKRDWDVRRTEANQVYLGVRAESPLIWHAVNSTQGQVLVCKSNQANMQYELFPAYYCSTCGGHTENSKNVFGDSFEPLVGVACPYCKSVAKPGIFFWPMAKFDKLDVTNKLLKKYPKLKQLGQITGIIAAKKSNYGEFYRLTLIKLLGSTGKSDFVRAEDLRLTIDPTGRKLKSTVCRIADMGDKWIFLSGRGWGHGVGMCQCGAQAMAREGKTAGWILSYYYPDSKILAIDY